MDASRFLDPAGAAAAKVAARYATFDAKRQAARMVEAMAGSLARAA